MYFCSTLLQATVLLSYVPNILCAKLKVAAKILMYYAQCCKKLHSNIVIYSIIVLLALKGRALYKWPGFLLKG